jgi:hypothetical protein
MAMSESRLTPLLAGFLYEVQPLGKRNKWRGRRGILDGGRGPRGPFDRNLSENTRDCHVYFPEDRKSAWVEPEDLVLVPGQLEWLREGDWIDCVWTDESDDINQGPRQRQRIAGFGQHGVFEGTEVHTVFEDRIAVFRLVRGPWRAALARAASEIGADGLALLETAAWVR